MRTVRNKNAGGRHVSPIKPPSSGVGKPTLYDNVRMPHMAFVLCSEYGFTHEQLGKVFGVSKKTIDSWSLNKPEFKKAVKAGRDAFDGEKVEQMLLKRAMGFEYEERTIKRTYVSGKDCEGNSVKIPAKEYTTTTRYVPPETKAITFWLTNRQPERWKMAISVNANIEQHSTQAKIDVKADLGQMDKDQLKMLRDLVSGQKQLTQSSENVIPAEYIIEQAEDALQLP